jgi:diguanylate cyclase (GGDEF)-like protein
MVACLSRALEIGRTRMSRGNNSAEVLEHAARSLAQRGQLVLTALNGLSVVLALIAMAAIGLDRPNPVASALAKLDLDPLSFSSIHQVMLVVGPLVVSLTLAIVVGLRSISYGARALAIVKDVEASALDRAMRDPLTGLHNRTGFKMRLDIALEMRDEHELLAVIYIDLDKFKDVNDTFGHEMGDKLLIAVADRLEEISRRDTDIARLGGDEFAMIVHGRASTDDIVRLAEAISAGLGEPFHIGNTELDIGGSVGVVIAPEDGTESTVLVRRADIAMYRVKAAGRGRALRFDHSMEDELRRRKFLEGELRHAIARNQLEVFYQPYMSSDGETVVGVEGLLRWHHPDEGMISPGVFIPLAEESGLIVEIGEWAMRRALVEAKDWADIHVAVNVSPIQFRRQDLLQRVLRIIAEVEIDPRRVEVEITEGVLMEDAENAIAVIKGFRDAGVHVALDDFGTGYASLSYLRRFPFDKLKVDQAFVRNLGPSNGSAAIIHSVVALGRSLGMTVHAEGVETLEHHIFLRAAGCHHFQGFYFAKPMPRAQCAEFVARKSGYGMPLSRRA